jgi:hypothetical protein
MVGMMSDILVFESFYEGNNLFYISIVAFVILILLITNLKTIKEIPHKVYYKIFVVFISFLFLIMLYDIYNIYITNRAIKDKTYRTIEGKVKNLILMGKKHSRIEAFEINNIYFEILYPGRSINQESLFYEYVKEKGGPIHKNGQKVKIHYIALNGENKIIKMWVYPENDSNSSLSKAPTR